MGKKSNITVVVGAQWGDEGKGKVSDILTYTVGIRWNGGSNAGANVIKGGRHVVLHGIPAAALEPSKIAYVGSGCVLNPVKTREELAEIVKAGFGMPKNLSFSPFVTFVQPAHAILDQLTGKSVGTTGNGIGPAYASIAQRQQGDLRKNVRLAEYLHNPDEYKKIIRANLEDLVRKEGALFGASRIDIGKLTEEFDVSVRELERYMQKDPACVNKLYVAGNDFLLQGANSVMLDGVTGPVPFVTSSRTLVSAALLGSDLAPYGVDRVIGVAKVIMSRVGNGPFISEFGGDVSEKHCAEDGGYKFVKEVETSLYNASALLKRDYNVNSLLESASSLNLGIALRMLGGEYGATTKRPRRIGALDLVQLRDVAVQNRIDYLFLTKVDCLRHFADSSLPGIPIVTRYELDGQEIDYVPVTSEEQRKVKAKVEYLPHIRQDLSSVKSPVDLTDQVKEFIRFVEEKTGIAVCGIGVGQKDEQKVNLRQLY